MAIYTEVSVKKDCCRCLFSWIKTQMTFRQQAYKANREYAKAHAMKLMQYDLTEMLEFEWVESNKPQQAE